MPDSGEPEPGGAYDADTPGEEFGGILDEYNDHYGSVTLSIADLDQTDPPPFDDDASVGLAATSRALSEELDEVNAFAVEYSVGLLTHKGDSWQEGPLRVSDEVHSRTARLRGFGMHSGFVIHVHDEFVNELGPSATPNQIDDLLDTHFPKNKISYFGFKQDLDLKSAIRNELLATYGYLVESA